MIKKCVNTVNLKAKMKEIVNSVKLFTLFTVLIISLFTTYAHTDGEDPSQVSQEALEYNSPSKLLPFYYFAHGDYISGIGMILFWIAIIAGTYNLVLILLGRAV